MAGPPVTGGKGQVILTATYFIILITVRAATPVFRFVMLQCACMMEADAPQLPNALSGMRHCGAGACEWRRSDLLARAPAVAR